MTSFKYILFACLILGMASLENLSAQSKAILSVDDLYNDIEFSISPIQQVHFKNNSVTITQYGAVGNGLVKNTDAFNKSIDAVVKQGGGKVIVPAGIWLTGPIHLKSNVNLHLEQGALILFSKDFNDYPLIQTSFEGLNTARCISPIHAENAENIAITGSGVIDGNGDAWRPVKKDKMTDAQWKKLVASGGVLTDDKKMWYPTASALQGSKSNISSMSFQELEQVKDFLRPVMVSFVNCKTVLLDGPTFQNSPAWNIHPLMCEDLTIRNLNVRNPWYSQNGDGLDLESCNRALVYNNTFDVGDDAICLKSGKDKDGRDRNMPTQNVIIKNNIVYHGHGGFVIGSEMSGGVKNVHISNCNFIGTDTGLRFKSTRGRGGVVENIYISDIYMNNIPTDAIRFNLFYGGKAPDMLTSNASSTSNTAAQVPVTDETPSFRNIYMKNITVVNSERAGFFMGLPEMNLKDIHLENAFLQAKHGITFIDADGIQIRHVNIDSQEQAIQIYNGKNMNFDTIDFSPNQNHPILIKGKASSTIRLNFKDAQSSYQLGTESSPKTVIIEKSEQ